MAKKTTVLLKTSLVLVFLESFLQIIAFLAPGWFLHGQDSRGLWYECFSNLGCYSLWPMSNSTGSIFAGLRGTVTIALISYLTAMAAAITFIIKKYDYFRLIMAVASLFGAVFALISVILAATLTELGSLYYSFGISIATFIIGLLAGGLGLLGRKEVELT